MENESQRGNETKFSFPELVPAQEIPSVQDSTTRPNDEKTADEIAALLENVHEAAEHEVTPEVQRPPAEFSVATVNTQRGEALRHEHGLGALPESTDVLTLQEVIGPTQELTEQLNKLGYRLVHHAPQFALAIAVRTGSGLSEVEGSVRERELSARGKTELKISHMRAGKSHEFSGRGLIAAKFRAQNGSEVTIATTHPSTLFTSRKREGEMDVISEELSEPYYDGNVVFAADFNSARNRFAEEQLQEAAGLSEVDLGGESTWDASKSTLLHHRVLRRIRGEAAMAKYDRQLDAVFYRGDDLEAEPGEVVPIESDHKAVRSTFRLKAPEVAA